MVKMLIFFFKKKERKRPGRAMKQSEWRAISAFLWCMSATGRTSPTVSPVICFSNTISYNLLYKYIINIIIIIIHLLTSTYIKSYPKFLYFSILSLFMSDNICNFQIIIPYTTIKLCRFKTFFFPYWLEIHLICVQ